jgi:hypothetical protein
MARFFLFPSAKNLLNGSAGNLSVTPAGIIAPTNCGDLEIMLLELMEQYISLCERLQTFEHEHCDQCGGH